MRSSAGTFLIVVPKFFLRRYDATLLFTLLERDLCNPCRDFLGELTVLTRAMIPSILSWRACDAINLSTSSLFNDI